MSESDINEYYKTYSSSSKIHAENIMTYGPAIPFGYPTAQVEQLERISFISSNAEGLILDIGSDSGYILHKCGGGIGIDLSLLRVKASKHWYPKLSFIHALAEHLPFREAFNTVIMTELLEHVLSPETVLAEALRVLKPEGKLIVTVPDEIHGVSHENPEHLRKFTKAELTKLLSRFCKIVLSTYIEGEYPAWCLLCRKQEIN